MTLHAFHKMAAAVKKKKKKPAMGSRRRQAAGNIRAISKARNLARKRKGLMQG